MTEVDAQGLNFSSADLVKLMAATYLPLCDELEASGVLDRGRLADTMGFYVDQGELSPSAALVSALQIVLRRPLFDTPKIGETPTREVVLRLIPGGLT